MFSKLVFIVDDEEIEFQLHELIKILQQVTDTQKACASPSSIPPYPDYEKSIIENFKIFSADIINKYAAHFDVNKGNLESMLENFNRMGLNAYISTQDYDRIMSYIKSQKQPDKPFISRHEFNRLILPPFIPAISDVFGWLGLTRYARETEEKIKSGWWLNIGERIILLRNLPGIRQHFYVSDHGNCDDILVEIKQNSIAPNSADGRKRMRYCFAFWEHYENRLDTQEKGYVKESFIILLHKELGGDDARNEFLLFILSLPKSYRFRTLKKGCLSYNNMDSYIGMRDDETSPWIEPPSKEVLSKITAEAYAKYADVFKQTLERVRYLGNVQTTTFIKQLFDGGLNPFFTQIDQIFHSIDAEQYKIFFVLNQLALKLGKGWQEFLLRPIRSFGLAEEGTSYRGFARAFKEYFQSELSSVKNSSEIAAIMRSLLQGRARALEEESLYFLPNLVSAWFVSEAVRNEASVMSGLMLLDLIESGIELSDEDNNNLYSWHHVLVHPEKPTHTMDKVSIVDMYGDEIDLAYFDGMHPMAHAGSIQDAKTTLGEKQKLSAVRQKEGHLIIHWFSEKIKDSDPGLQHYLVIARPESESTHIRKCCLLEKKTTSYKIIETLLAAKQPSNRIKEDSILMKKWEILHKIIIPNLQGRLSTLDNLLNSRISLTPSNTNTAVDVRQQCSGASYRKQKFPSILFAFGMRKNKMTGPKVAKILEKILEKKDKGIANETADKFIKWNRDYNRHFNLQSIKEFKLR